MGYRDLKQAQASASAALRTVWSASARAPHRLALAIVIVLLAAAIVWEISSAARTARFQPPVAMAERGEGSAFAARINEAAWFGVAGRQADGPGTAMPSTDLSLVLRGVFLAGGSVRPSAIIERPDGEADVVRAGAEIIPGVTLAEVFADRVVIDRDGRQEQLYFPSGEAAVALAAADAATAAAPAADSSPGAQSDEQKRASILRRLEELRARGAG